MKGRNKVKNNCLVNWWDSKGKIAENYSAIKCVKLKSWRGDTCKIWVREKASGFQAFALMWVPFY